MPRATRFFSLFYISILNVQKGGSIHAPDFESTHGGKIKEPFSNVHGWFNIQIKIVVARLYSRMIYGSQNGTYIRALDCHNKLSTRIIFHAHSRNLFCCQSYPRLRIMGAPSLATELRKFTGNRPCPLQLYWKTKRNI